MVDSEMQVGGEVDHGRRPVAVDDVEYAGVALVGEHGYSSSG